MHVCICVHVCVCVCACAYAYACACVHVCVCEQLKIMSSVVWENIYLDKLSAKICTWQWLYRVPGTEL